MICFIGGHYITYFRIIRFLSHAMSWPLTAFYYARKGYQAMPPLLIKLMGLHLFHRSPTSMYTSKDIIKSEMTTEWVICPSCQAFMSFLPCLSPCPCSLSSHVINHCLPCFPSSIWPLSLMLSSMTTIFITLQWVCWIIHRVEVPFLHDSRNLHPILGDCQGGLGT